MKTVYKIIFAALSVPALFGGGFVFGHGIGYQTGLEWSESQNTASFTGVDMWEAINEYRVDKGLKPFTLDEVLCHNMVKRFEQLQQRLTETGTTNHDGLEEYEHVTHELIAGGEAPQQVIKLWEESPGHQLAITSQELTNGCVYAQGGNALLFLR
ncbi:MAG: hypothetical protein COT71_02080 [Candidatus Andersenbacteria bacterium CG10_big_fil_rev_8_21_14_0_10_54_11]|uniref:SCP domain-containing protein n=1 Tax=Candidatus Andersenbacteria bacterium CG10_big_fil_rev_8_21_14_0_10_54_11 TaxID=1974485 RepID=A0A2M6WZJ4_9BACT|nr:MAG: hypothetical protein COT71_02080 [Candidatus Andersenbacteria bacterium CG10_big_fil_rev_8_21_14_0_10_54_11]